MIALILLDFPFDLLLILFAVVFWLLVDGGNGKRPNG